MFHYVQAGDVIVMDGVEIGADVLAAILHPDARLLWAFLKRNGQIHPVCYDEGRVIWIQAEEEKDEKDKAAQLE